MNFPITILVISVVINIIESDNDSYSGDANNRDSSIFIKSDTDYGLEFNCTIDDFISNYNYLVSKKYPDISTTDALALNGIKKEDAITKTTSVDGINGTEWYFTLLWSDFPGGKIKDRIITVLFVDDHTNNIVIADCWLDEDFAGHGTPSDVAIEYINRVYSSLGIENAFSNYFSNIIVTNSYDTLVYSENFAFGITHIDVASYSSVAKYEIIAFKEH